MSERLEHEWDRPISDRPEPDHNALVLARKNKLESETPLEAYCRQQWECAMGATKVALDAWRRVFPSEVLTVLADGSACQTAEDAEHALSAALGMLDALSSGFNGVLVDDVLATRIDEQAVRRILGFVNDDD